MAGKTTRAKLTRDEMERERERLEHELSLVIAELAEIEERLQDRGDYSLGEGDPAIQNWELNLVLYQRMRDKADSIRAALRRVADGTYGVCQRCGARIDRARLDIILDASLCIDCARQGGE